MAAAYSASSPTSPRVRSHIGTWPLACRALGTSTARPSCSGEARAFCGRAKTVMIGGCDLRASSGSALACHVHERALALLG
eukprot:13327394-Alexandrium_andersonii.AAC.1